VYMFIGRFSLSELLTENVLRFSLIYNVLYISLDAFMVQTCMTCYSFRQQGVNQHSFTGWSQCME
jgi:hypothetical protein